MTTRWVIGGTSGIGEAIATELRYEPGKTVEITGVEECDVRDDFALRSFLKSLCEVSMLKRSKVNGIVYCAGINHLEPLGDMGVVGLAQAKDLIDTNLTGFIRLMDAVMDPEVFPEEWRDGLSIIAVSSDAARRPMRTSMAYCASKAGLDMAVRVAAREAAAHGIRVLGLAPGMTEGTGMTEYIDTMVPLIRGWSKEQAARYESQQEVTPGRVPRSALARVVLSMVNGPKHWTGDIVTVNGGR